MKKLKLLDTFSGIGGFSYAAEKLVGGFETTQFIEIDPYCQKVLNKHWPNVPIHDDIRTFTAQPYSADLITGGFPCTDISVAGRGEGITETTRSGLWFQLIRTICMVRPKYFILENVSAILANGLDIVLRDIYKAGYDAEWCCIPSSAIGACHERDRWWLIAYPNDYGSPSSKRIRVDDKGNSITQEGQNKTIKSERSSNPRDSRIIQHSSKWRNSRHRLNSDWRGYASKPTLRRGDDGLRGRVDRLKALGNSVVPQVAAIPLQRMKDIHEQLTTVDH